MTKRTWLQNVIDLATNAGIMVNGNKVKAFPIKKEDKWIYGKCPKCGHEHGIVFITEDKANYVLFCMKCNKYSHSPAGQKKPAEVVTNNECKCLTSKHTKCKNPSWQQGICKRHWGLLEKGNIVLGHDGQPIEIKF